MLWDRMAEQDSDAAGDEAMIDSEAGKSVRFADWCAGLCMNSFMLGQIMGGILIVIGVVIGSRL